ncbi:hypothetical protein PUR59_30600 [Streptomyces sp. SP18ES09]|uniref:hypothetical protein n=1 Tax=Streptomyces sp. SP18ES09 TaxID=3002532 RepID=UPI002E786E56|nr:hypothetical protein [Streptomyces sp. SP18ES09]MEE1819352.1 hypothetical protein [Streptomyces sp. SP18ES09]
MITSAKPAAPEIVRQTPVIFDSKQLTVSTIRIAHGHYDTVIFDDSPTRKHAGMLLGGFVIDSSSKFAADRESAMDQHRAALEAVRSEEPTEVAA